MAIDINIGALCLVRQNGSFFGPTVWVARAPDGDGHWSLLRKTAGGRSKREGRSGVGRGDLIVIKAAPAYQAGDVVWHKALRYLCLADRGDLGVELTVPENSVPLRRGGFNVRVPAGNTLTVRIWCLSKWIEKGIEA